MENKDPWAVSRSNKGRYLIVYGDVDEYLAEANKPISDTLTFTPLLQKLQADLNSTIDNLPEILTVNQKSIAIYLTSFFKDKEAFTQAFSKDPGSYLEMHDQLQEMECYNTVGIGKELFVIDFDLPAVLRKSEITTLGFPEEWEACQAPVLLSTEEVKLVSGGFSEMLKTVVLTAHASAYLQKKYKLTFEGAFEALIKLPYLNYTNTDQLNADLRRDKLNVPFTIFRKIPKSNVVKIKP